MARFPMQLELTPRTWGGRRAGAGRKPSGRPVGVAHQIRAVHEKSHPVHATLRARHGLPSLRQPATFQVLRRGLARASRRHFRVIQFSVQTNHVHVLVEATDTHALSRGLQGLAIRLARAVNRTLGRRGKVWGDRYHARGLATPREVRNALVYVLQNFRKHHPGGTGLDPCSSAAWFDGFRDSSTPSPVGRPVALPRTWLAAVGWRRRGLIGVDEIPASRRKMRVAARRSTSLLAPN